MTARPSIVFAMCSVGALVGFQPEKERGLWSYSRPQAAQDIRPLAARIGIVTRSSANGGYALRIDFDRSEMSNVEFRMAAGKADWRPFGALVVRVFNPSPEPIGFGIEVGDANGASTKGQTQSDLGPHQTATLALTINAPWPADLGMRGAPPIGGVRRMDEDHKSIQLGNVARFRVFPTNAEARRSLIIEDIRLLPGVTYDGIVDAFGQFALDDWPGKLNDLTDLQMQRNQEEAELRDHPALPDRDEYGGWASGPQLEATGYFRTEKRHGKWWLVTPSGHLFFSLGMNVVSVRGGATVIEGREQMFRWLPPADDPLAAHYGASHQAPPIGLKIKLVQGRTFDFFTANLARKYGTNWVDLWTSTTLARLRAWGFNTIGNWSDRSVYRQHQIPYTATLKIEGPVAEIPGGGDFWGRMLDPFDPSFAKAVARAMQRDTGCVGDAWCVGYFVDNEMSWGTGKDERSRYGLALGALSLGESSPGKQAFIKQLEGRYGSIDEFNEAWNLHFASWSQMLTTSIQSDGDFTERMREDMGAFLKLLARRYFQIIHETLQQRDPSHLYLGSRFYFYTPESVEACAAFCDVVSFNIYEPTVERERWRFVEQLNKPAIIGEFHMGATDRGMFHPGLVNTPSQWARAAAFKKYVRSVVDHPAFVGCHYFQYKDEPLTGRTIDGENYSIGFVDVADRTYREMVAAAKTLGSEIFERRAR
jgi:hypothetical protein